MRTVMLTGNLDIGGAERTALELAVGLRRQGHELRVTSLRGGGPLGVALRDAGVPLTEGVLTFRYDATAAWRIARQLRRDAIDNLLLVDVHRNAMFCGLWGAKFSKRNVRTVLWCSSVPTGQAGNFTPRLRRYLRRGMLDEVVCVSDVQREMLTRYALPPDRLRTIQNGVNLDRFTGVSPATDLPGPAGSPTLLHVANVMPDKDFDTLLAASRMLKDRGVGFRLLLAGRGTDAPGMQDRISSLGLSEHVYPLGAREDVPAVLAAVEAVVLATRSEVFNVSVLEAMAAGRAVLVSDVAGFSDMFQADREGLKVVPQDAPALAEGMRRLLQDADLRATLAAAGRKRVELFSRTKMCEAFQDLLERPITP